MYLISFCCPEKMHLRLRSEIINGSYLYKENYFVDLNRLRQSLIPKYSTVNLIIGGKFFYNMLYYFTYGY